MKHDDYLRLCESNFNDISQSHSVYSKDSRSPYIINYQNFLSLPFYTFDRTWAEAAYMGRENLEIIDILGHETNYRLENNKHVLDFIPPELSYIEEDRKTWKVRYEYNSDWFRCDEFSKNHDGLHIVFSGCSNTEGVGGNIEDTWSHILYNKIKEKNNVSGYYNLGRGGSGWHKVVHNFREYVVNYGAPDILVIHMPNILRFWESDWIYHQKVPYGDNVIKTNYEESDLQMHRVHFPVFLTAMMLFQEYCNSIGTKLLWTTWHYIESINIHCSSLFTETFFYLKPVSATDLAQNVIKNGLTLKHDDISFRDRHPGRLLQNDWAEQYYDQLAKRGWIEHD